MGIVRRFRLAAIAGAGKRWRGAGFQVWSQALGKQPACNNCNVKMHRLRPDLSSKFYFLDHVWLMQLPPSSKSGIKVTEENKIVAVDAGQLVSPIGLLNAQLEGYLLNVGLPVSDVVAPIAERKKSLRNSLMP